MLALTYRGVHPVADGVPAVAANGVGAPSPVPTESTNSTSLTSISKRRVSPSAAGASTV
ncbi:hypothetical protein [Halospeciosus flavus]|uniref:hypothetical protein n=1 Tax=Halospeciosus flavus TaxID=3032283 RepID=UPI003621E099